MAKAEKSPAQSGRAASNALFARYATALRRYLVRRMRRPGETADLTQEIFVRFLRKQDRPEVIREPLAFLFGIAANVIREQAGTQRAELVALDSELADEAITNAEPDAAVREEERANLQGDLARALRTLPANHLAVVLLVKRDGLSIAEAARQTGFAEGTVNVYLCEARWKLRKMLQDYARKEQT